MTASTDREVVTTRALGVPRARVFDAFRDPVRLARWWGPNGFSNTFREHDFRPGGFWRFTMHGPDGTDHPNESVFVEVVPDARIVFEHLADRHHFVMTITFADEGSGTRLTWVMRFDTAEHCAAIRSFVANANEQNFDRLEAELARTA